MSTTYRPYQPDQSFLLPPTPRDWLPEKHLAYFISDTIDALDLRPFYKSYEGDGRRKQTDEPAMMLKVLVYAYASGTYSSRKIARRLHCIHHLLLAVFFREMGAVIRFLRRPQYPCSISDLLTATLSIEAFSIGSSAVVHGSPRRLLSCTQWRFASCPGS